MATLFGAIGIVAGVIIVIVLGLYFLYYLCIGICALYYRFEIAIWAAIVTFVVMCLLYAYDYASAGAIIPWTIIVLVVGVIISWFAD